MAQASVFIVHKSVNTETAAHLQFLQLFAFGLLLLGLLNFFLGFVLYLNSKVTAGEG